jgi:hypothetical protein
MSKSDLELIFKNNPNLKLLSKSKLYEKLQKDGYETITRKDISDYFDPKEVKQIYSKPKNDYKFKITAPPHSFQIDVVLLPKYKTTNKGITQFFIAVDILSRKAYAYTLTSGTMKDVLKIYEEFLIELVEEGDEINSVAGDNFFNNKEFIRYNDRNFINVFTDVAKDDHISKSGSKLGIVDRCIRTLKDLIQKYMLTNNTTKWTDFLDEIIELYNDSPNSGLKGSTPNEVFDDRDYSEILYKNQKKYNQKINDSLSIKTGDTVRAIVGKGIFEKEKARFSLDLYTVMGQEGYRFILKDEKGQQVKRKYRPSELKVVKTVTDRLEVQKEDNQVRKMQRSKAFNSYDEIVTAIDKKNEPKSKRTIRKPKRYD